MRWITKSSQYIIVEFPNDSEKLNDSRRIDISKTSYKEFWVSNKEGDFKILRYFRVIILNIFYIEFQKIFN